ncbi:hypothetical protein [Xanthomonas arboricola]|uniref:hypothetical protein n=1 Tax=Xanthomonas arboricola TaxID=56448 RepID=UPI0025AF360B|nr:hypothetical protein [Xanthomonas arboricola]MDN0209635.1 hypothetical protein [Xanthomonas arboricola pv. corylina]MDN0213972.1 hypothetical protein [Xanthomonas arboricola pv. corylina]
MDYFVIIVAFGSALAAIVGNTWDRNANGIDKLTCPGRVTLFFAVAALVGSGYLAYQQREEKKTQEIEKKKLGMIISGEITRSLDAITSPFRSLYIENNGGILIKEEKITYDQMLVDSMIEKAQDTCLELRPKTFYSFPDGGTWNDIFRSGITNGIVRLDQVVDRYGVSMNTEMLDAIQDLRVNGYFSRYAYTNPRRNSSHVSKDAIPQCVIGQAIGSHKKYLTMLKRIDALNDGEKLVR